MVFEARFGRHFEYYTGMVFQIEIEGAGVAGQIAGGGRYDGLIGALSRGERHVPAVGAAIHPSAFLARPTGLRMNNALILGVPSEGGSWRMRSTFSDCGSRDRENRRRARLSRRDRGDADIAVEFLSAGEIARHLQTGRIHLGVTGEDLVREQIPDVDERLSLLLKLGFGHANVIVAVPECWLDVETMADLEEAGALFTAEHGRRLRVATKYPMLTRRFFAARGVAHYRTVESLGATEGAPATGAAEAIVDITSTGATLQANGLRILRDGLILQSEANLVATTAAAQSAQTAILCSQIVDQIAGALAAKT